MLLAGSPAIDRGCIDLVPPDVPDLNGAGNTTEPIPFDIDGLARITDDPPSLDFEQCQAQENDPVPDMGAHEVQDCGLCPWDTFGGGPNGNEPDGAVSASDLAFLLGSWGPVTSGKVACIDTNGDGQISAADLANLLGHWGPCP